MGIKNGTIVQQSAVLRYRRDDAFSYPLVVPGKTLYEDLAVGPDAFDDEIRWAKSETVRFLQAEQITLNAELDSIYTAIQGLKEAYTEYENLIRNDNTSENFSEITKRVEMLEQQAEAKDSDFKKKRERNIELTTKINLINSTSLDKPSERLKYDIAHPPLALLKLVDGSVDEFLEGKALLFFLRRDISRFLTTKGEVVFHPSDLTRDDFTTDFVYNPLLDDSPK